MKKALSITALLLAVLMIAMCCVACGDDDKKSSDSSSNRSNSASEGGSDNDDGNEAHRDNDIFNDDDSDNRRSDDDDDNTSSLAGTYTLHDHNDTATLVINSDNTGTMDDGINSAACVFNVSSGTVSLTLYGETITGTYTFNGSEIVIVVSGRTLGFVKDGSGSSGSDNGGSTPAANSLAGSYTLDSDEYGYLVINADYTGHMGDGEHTATCVFDVSSGTVTMTYSNQPVTGTFTYTSSSVSISANGVNLTFIKD